jgi:hypothetical protein
MRAQLCQPSLKIIKFYRLCGQAIAAVAYDMEWLEYYNRKNIKKVKRKGYRLESIIAVDDTPQKWEPSYGNLVRVNPFEGEETDDELKSLLLYLDKLRYEENICRVEKRFWRNRLTRSIGESYQIR